MKDSRKIIWPLSIRLIHWSIALIVLLNIFILEEGDPPHRWLGYAAVLIVAIRFYYGYRGKGHVHFSAFQMSPSHIKIFLTKHFTKNPNDYEGHNPLASIVYFFMWFAIIALGISGWMMGLDRFWGDETLESVHIYISNFLEALVVIHLIGVFLDSWLFKRKTWMWMITGKK